MVGRPPSVERGTDVTDKHKDGALTIPYEDYLLPRLKEKAEAVSYIRAAAEDSDEVFALAVADVAKAWGVSSRVRADALKDAAREAQAEARTNRVLDPSGIARDTALTIESRIRALSDGERETE